MRLLLIALVVTVIAVAFIFVARSGPRVTTIEHRREDEEKDRDDA